MLGKIYPVPKKTTNRYLVRNKLHQTVGDFSEEEIISQIRIGKFSGEEEAAIVPTSQWNRLSTYPEFYDALIKRVLGVGVPTPAPNEEPASLQEPIEKEGESTEIQGAHPIDTPAESQEATAQLVQPGSLSPRISDSEIAGLFSEVSQLKQPIAELSNSRAPDQAEIKPRSFNQRKAILWGGALVLLIILFQSGGKSPDSGGAKNSNDLTVNEAELKAPEVEDQKIFYQKSAEQALQSDSLPGYLLAADFYQKSIEFLPENLEIYEGITTAFARYIEGKPEDSKRVDLFNRYLKQGRALEPQRTSFFRAEAIVARAKGDHKKASELLDLALETDPLNPDNLLVQAEWMIQEQKFKEAIPLLKSILSLSRESIRANYLLALAEFQDGNFEESWNLSQRVTQINPAHTASYALMGDILSKRNDLKAAKAVYLLSAKFSPLANKKIATYALQRAENLSQLSGDEQQANRLRLLVEAQETPEEKPASDELSKAERDVYADATYFERLGTEAIASKNFERAEGFYLAATLAHPSNGKLWTRLGETREALARTREEFRWAAMTYEKAIQISPEEADAYLRLGLLESEQSNWGRSFQALQKAEEIAPEDPMVQLALGKHFFARKDFRSATERLRAARRINPTIAEVSYYQGMLYKVIDPENPRAAMRNFEEAYSKDPGNYDALTEWLKLKVVTFEKMFAVKFLRNMLAVDPHNSQLLWAFGEVYSANKEFNRAIQYYRRALDADKNSAKVRLSMARALASLGRIDEAISEYKLASDLDAKNGEGYFDAAELLYQSKNYSMAKDLLLGLLKVIPNYPGARRLLAMSYQAMDQPDLAIREMTQEARSNPMNYQFSIELAELLMVNQKFVEATQELAAITNLPIEKTVVDQRAPSGFKKEPTGLKPYRVRGLLLLSRCYRELKRFEAADGAVQAALTLDPESLDLKLERGFVYHNLGRHTEAAKDFNEFLSKNPNGAEAQTVKEILNKTVIEE